MNDLSDRVERELEIVIEQRRQEYIAFSGGLKAIEEMIEHHKKFLEKSKDELVADIEAGKMTQEGANYILRWLGRSDASLKEYQDQAKSNRDLRTGEFRAYESVRRLFAALREQLEREAQEAAKVVLPEPTIATMNVKKRREKSNT